MNLGKQIQYRCRKMAPAYRLTAVSHLLDFNGYPEHEQDIYFPNGWMIPGKTGSVPQNLGQRSTASGLTPAATL